ncbi:MAG: acyl-CoA dehydratase activase-related protein, partial [Eubacteriales bacterium]
AISAGLSTSVVKNALYKVIRAPIGDIENALGHEIVVQGGTFLNDAVLRAFELEIGRNVVRPNISALMGAYGAALYAQTMSARRSTSTATITLDGLNSFTHEVKAISCGLCNNNCRLTVNTFSGGRKYIGGNRCERPLIKAGTKSGVSDADNGIYNIYDYKLSLLDEYKSRSKDGGRGKIGIPMGLNMYELLPFWHTLLTDIGFEVVTSPMSNRRLYLSGQQTIPSDTVCFPAKLMHGHIEALIASGVKAIFYPCLTYNLDEGLGDNHYNCPVVAYYPEVIAANVPELADICFVHDYFGIHRPRDFAEKFYEKMSQHFDGFTRAGVRAAVLHAYDEYTTYMQKVALKGEEYMKLAREQGRHIIVLAGRPYHMDHEVNHGIARLICSLGAVVISEDSISDYVDKFRTNVLNQWTYHSRMYAAAKYVLDKPDMDLVQLVSFGCGVDAITTDEVREILERGNKIYTQIKIDEITNLGAVKIRLRSLFAAIEERKEMNGRKEEGENA